MVPVTWAPGQGTVRFPADTGVFVSKDDMLVVQVHYNLVNDQGPDQTSVKLEVADQVTRAGFIDLQDDFLGAAAAGNPTVIPAGEAAFDVEWSQGVDGLLDYYGSLVGANLPYVDVYGFMPHMHGRGVKERVMITGGDADVCLGQIDDWDFNWQFMYWYQQPVRLERGSNQSIQTTCTYDTSNEAGPVYPGFGTDAEMCLIGMYVVLP